MCCSSHGVDALRAPLLFQHQAVLKSIEKASAVALCALSLSVDLSRTLCGFAFGFIWGVIDRLQHPCTELSEGGVSPSFMESILGTRLPAEVSLLAQAAIFACHIDHHADVFCPMTGLAAGAWAGNQMAAGYQALRG